MFGMLLMFLKQLQPGLQKALQLGVVGVWDQRSAEGAIDEQGADNLARTGR
jgi:hypothetical protein